MLDKKYIYFLKVVESGSFTSAAKELYLTQPALSKQMNLLEDELGIRLFDRSGYRPILTDKGKFLYDKLNCLIEEIEEIKENLIQNNKIETKIGITGAYENRELMKVLSDINQNYDNIDFTFIKGNFNDSLEKLINREVDFSVGIESTFKNVDNMSYSTLYEYQMCIICSLNHPLACYDRICMEKIKNESFIVLSKKFGLGFYNELMDSFKLDNIRPNIKKVVNSFDELIFSVSIGEGIAIVSKNVVRQTEVKVIDLLHSHHASKYVIAYPKNISKELQTILCDIIEYFKNHN